MQMSLFIMYRTNIIKRNKKLKEMVAVVVVK